MIAKPLVHYRRPDMFTQIMHAGGDWKPDEGRFGDEIDRRAAKNIGLKQGEVMQAIETCELDRSRRMGNEDWRQERGEAAGA